MNKNTVYKIGFWSSLLVGLSVLGFAVSIILDILGINTGPFSFISSFFIAAPFIALVASIHYYAPEDKKIWSLIGLSFAIIYAVLISIVYYLQVTIVYNTNVSLGADVMKLFDFKPGSPIFAIDMLGYSFMCLSTLFTAPVFFGSKLRNWIKYLFIFHGLLYVQTLLFPAFHFSQSSGGTIDIIGKAAYLFWCMLFISISVLLMIFYEKLLKEKGIS